ncbi:thioredoxin family protein [Rhodococcus tibetensis]|uniref:Thioredoxin family protein n=1 Tax=Rhodococcus tibetensis TaxID=2965064 RepID=A0ABT1Q830_9NOCA|nr:thioredoxin family protein [Rhodococcus sp. FXJ9.536]MCQ4117900.1 thioredoxin family protein [Rhodococcus sp. FXJ9.536]
MTGITLLIVTLLVAIAFGLVWQRRQGRVRTTSESDSPVTDERRRLLEAAGAAASADSATVLHFSADWCGPCAAVRRVVGQVVNDLSEEPHPPAEVELDIDEYPALARELGVLSLPTTFILDSDLRERFRVSGVPAAADLRAALEPLSRPPASNS